MARYIDADKLTDKLEELQFNSPVMTPVMKIYNVIEIVEDQPTADVVEVETIKAWLYKIAINNVGYVIDGDFSDACEEIISRLYGLRNFVKECTPKERGGEK